MAQSTTIETVTITKPFKVSFPSNINNFDDINIEDLDLMTLRHSLNKYQLLLMIKYVKWIVNRKVSRASVTPGGKIEGDCALFSASPP